MYLKNHFYNADKTKKQICGLISQIYSSFFNQFMYLVDIHWDINLLKFIINKTFLSF